MNKNSVVIKKTLKDTRTIIYIAYTNAFSKKYKVITIFSSLNLKYKYPKAKKIRRLKITTYYFYTPTFYLREIIKDLIKKNEKTKFIKIVDDLITST